MGRAFGAGVSRVRRQRPCLENLGRRWPGWEGRSDSRARTRRKRINVVNAHLQSQYSGHDYSEVREAQLGELATVVSKIHPSVAAIVAGDLNTDAREPLYSHIAALGTDLTAETRQLSNGGTTANPRDGLPEWIDYVVAANLEAWTVSIDLELVANQSADVPYSDHSGLFCVIRLTLK